MTRRTSIVALCGAWLLAHPVTASAQHAGDKPPDIGSLAGAGRATLERLGKQAATWTTTTHLPGGARVLVEVLASPTMRRTVLSIEAQGRRGEVLRIIERDGSWYATEGRKAGRYRPYEALFELPTAYFFFGRSEPQFVVEGIDLGTFEKVNGGAATYRTPLAEPLRQQVTNALGEWERLLRQQPGRAADPEAKRTAERMRDLLQKGTATEVEVATGMITRLGAADRQTEFHEFRWLDRVPPEAFEVGATKWEDFTGDPTEAGTDDLLMISHSGAWRPGMKSGDTDGRLLDLRTGRYRRIPFHGAMALPGCFLKGRFRVAVTGVDPLSGSMGLYEVDLKTGENRRLGGALLSAGFTLMPALSPDGRTVAVLHKGTTGRLLDTQVCLVDLETGEARAVGEPRDMAFLSWLPDGKGIVLLHREVADPSDLTGPRTATIARMDLEGRLTKIREGGMPVLLNDGKTILFEDTKSRTWQTCGLDGGDLKPYAGGMAGYGFPSPAPDGKRIIMMHFRQGSAPEPTILPIGGSDGKPAITAPGLWATPAWR
jgi:Tol biopolymer transport system component